MNLNTENSRREKWIKAAMAVVAVLLFAGFARWLLMIPDVPSGGQFETNRKYRYTTDPANPSRAAKFSDVDSDSLLDAVDTE